jgi:hypothetical protein
MNTPSTICYTLIGSGPEHVLVLHDWNGDHSNYDPILPYLDGATFTYAFADLRGYGKSKQLTGVYTVGEISNDCLRLADALRWGVSYRRQPMTGMAVQRLTWTRPSGSRAPSRSVRCRRQDRPRRPRHCVLRQHDKRRRRLSPPIKVRDRKPSTDGRTPSCARTAPPFRQPAARAISIVLKTNFVAEVMGNDPFLVIVGDKDQGSTRPR